MQNSGLDEVQARIKIAGRNINNLSYAADTTLIAERQAELKSLRKLKEKSENGLKLNMHKRRSWHLAPSFPGKLMEKLWKQLQTSFSWVPKSLQMVTVAMELIDACSLEEKL